MNKASTVVLSLLLATLTGCGGGGSSDGTAPSDAGTNATSTGSSSDSTGNSPISTNGSSATAQTGASGSTPDTSNLTTGTTSTTTSSSTSTTLAGSSSGSSDGAGTGSGGTSNPASWTLTDIGTIDTNLQSVNRIGNSGQVAGIIKSGNTVQSFVYSDGKVTNLGGPDDPGTAYKIIVRAQNVNGGFVGCVQAVMANYGGCVPFLFHGGKFTSLSGLYPVGVIEQAVGINSSGKVVGNWVNGLPSDSGTQTRGGFILDNGNFTDLRPFGLEAASAISDKGYVAGAGGGHCFLYDGSKAVELGILSNGPNEVNVPYCDPADVNDNGDVVGNSNNHAFLYSGGKLSNISPPGTATSGAWFINNRGQALVSGTLPGGATAKFWYSQNVYTRLDTLDVFKTDGWSNLDFRTMNDQGQIAGTGTLNGKTHVFILSPS